MQSRNIIPKDKASQRKSAIITLILMVILLAIIFSYTWEVEKPDPKIEIAILFNNAELPPPPEEPIVPKPIQVTPENSSPSKRAAASNKRAQATGKVNSSKYKTNPPLRSEVQSKNSPVDAAPNSQPKDLNREESKSKIEDPNKALTDLLKRRNQGGGSSGEDPDGRVRGSRTQGNGQGSGTGEGIIGEGGRKLIKKVPGTMGDSQPSLSANCSATGRMEFTYTVDRSGKVTSVYRSGGISDPCLKETGIAWIKKYVKASKGNSTAKGVYKINF